MVARQPTPEARTRLANSYQTLATLANVQRDPAKAVDYNLKQVNELKAILEPMKIFSHIRSACSFNIGSIYFEMHNSVEAIVLFNKTLRQSEETGDYFWMNYALHGLGKIYLSIKNFPEAKEFFEKIKNEKGYRMVLFQKAIPSKNHFFLILVVKRQLCTQIRTQQDEFYRLVHASILWASGSSITAPILI